MQTFKFFSISNRIVFFIFILTTFQTSFSQQKELKLVDNFVDSNLQLHNLQIEKIFLHINKSSFQAGENIWFKAYIVNDADNKPSLATTNLHINVYDSNKKLISHHLFLADSGKSNGNILLNEELKSGTYFIEATTQWNQNFKSNAYITPFNIISQSTIALGAENNNANSEETNSSSANSNNLAIEFYPESKVLLNNTRNKIAFTSKLNGKGISASGEIIDNETGIIVAKIESNKYGMGEFVLYTKPNRTYTAFINSNGHDKHFTISKAQDIGYIITKSKNQTENNSINFTLKTNESTLKQKTGNHVFAVLHRKGKHNAIIPIKIKKNYINYSFNLSEELLFDGVNTITLFNEMNEPISEYSFFQNNTQNLVLNITKVLEDKDSLTLNFELSNPITTNMSISVLPEETLMYNDNNSIETAFLLAPYLENMHLNLNEFMNFTQSNNDLDLLLKTSAKQNMLPYEKNKNNEKDNLILAENGLTIKGNVSANVKDLRDYKVMLSSLENDLLLIDTIGQSNSFAFHNLHLKKPTKYKLALLNPKGEIIKTGFRLSDKILEYQPLDSINQSINIESYTKKHTLVNNNYESLPILKGVTTLDEVKLTFREKQENVLKDAGIEPNMYDSPTAQTYIIEEDANVITIFDYLQKLPGIRVIGDAHMGFVIYSRRGMRAISQSTPRDMAIIIDGIVMFDTSSLLSMRANDFIAVSVNQTGSRLGLRGMNGYVSFHSRNPIFGSGKNAANEDIHVNETELGFDIVTENFQNELLTFLNEESKNQYGTADWIPNFDLLPKGRNSLKINKNGFQNLKLIINGMNSEGEFIYKTKHIHSNSD